MSIKYIKVKSNISESNLKFLYHILKHRKFNISHNSMPSFEEHKKFVISNPYINWFIVTKNEFKIGSVYLNQDNSIGLNILEEYRHTLSELILDLENKLNPQKEVKSIISRNSFYNVSPKDVFFINTLKKLGYEVSKISFRKIET